jgi:two-component sensor histidine kinase
MMPKSADKTDARTARLLEYQQALAGFCRVAGETLPLDRLLHHATAQASRVTHVRHVKVMRYRPDRADLLLVAGVGWKPGVVGHATFGLDQASPAGRCFQTASPVVIDDLPGSPEYRTSPVLRDHGIVSVVNVPLRVDGRLWGVFEVDAATPHHFDEADVVFLSTFANIVGLALQRMETEQSLLDSLAQSAQAEARSEVLLRELQHRVKNNFQVILAFLALQRRHASDESRERFASVMDRVHAIALAHDQLTFQNNAGEVEFSDYLRALCANIDPHREGIAIEVEARRATLPIDRAVPAGLIVNELVTNSLKYAFDERGGSIRVTFSVDEDRGEASIEVADDGRGMGEKREGGLGLTLVKAFIGQISGQVEPCEVERGTCTRVHFPLVA